MSADVCDLVQEVHTCPVLSNHAVPVISISMLYSQPIDYVLGMSARSHLAGDDGSQPVMGWLIDRLLGCHFWGGLAWCGPPPPTHTHTQLMCFATHVFNTHCSLFPILQVTVACLWAAFFNKLLLPWSTRDWALEQLSTALSAAAQVLHTTSTLQFAATAATNTPTSSRHDVHSSSSSSSGGEDAVCGVKVDGGRGLDDTRVVLAAALLQQESALQKQVVEPVVAVQTGEASCMSLSDKGTVDGLLGSDCLTLCG